MLTITLTQNVDLRVSSVILLSLFLAEILSQLLISGLFVQQRNKVPCLNLEETVGHVLLRWIFLVCFVVSAIYLNLLIFFTHLHFAVVCILGLSLVLALTKSAVVFQCATRKWIKILLQMRLILIWVMIVLIMRFGSIEVDVVLSISLAVMLCILLISLWRVSTFGADRPDITSGPLFWRRSVIAVVPILFRYADLLIVPWIFAPKYAFAYLMARGVAHVIGLTLGALNTGLADPLNAAFQKGKHGAFAIVAARANLGVLLIGGGLCLAVLSVGPHVLEFVGLTQGEISDVLMWVVLAEAAPVFFGVTWILLDVSKQQRDIVLIAGIGILMIGLSSMFVNTTEIVDLAMIYACVHMVCTAGAAVLLGVRFGIWPGLTALLVRQIKLL